MLLTSELEIKLWGNTVKYYNDLGYKGKHGDIITINVNDLPKHSDKIVKVKCDYCNTAIKDMKYSTYVKSLKNIPKYACKECMYQKLKEVNQLLYGVDNYGQTQEYAEKIREVSLKKYGVNHYASLGSVKDKREKTTYERYHVKNYSKTDECRKKIKETSMFRYNVENPSQSQDIKTKTMETNICKYGVPWTMQNQKIREKANITLCENGNQKTSLQQLYLHFLYGGELNHPIKYYSADICFQKEKIDFEYDGGFHNGRVKLGRLSQEEFDQKELIRDKIIKREGYKIMRLISRRDYLPSDEILLQLFSHSKEYFSATNHTWITWDIDNSKMINAENKDSNGVFFDYGKLRRIKKDELPLISKEEIENLDSHNSCA